MSFSLSSVRETARKKLKPLKFFRDATGVDDAREEAEMRQSGTTGRIVLCCERTLHERVTL